MAPRVDLGAGWFPETPRVGASIAGALELAKQGVVLSDDVVRDLNIPVMKQALELMDTVFAVADDLGIGAEVRAAVYAIRGAEYAAAIAANFLPAGAAAGAGSAVFSGLGGVAALGAVVVVVVIVAWIFGGGGDDEARAKRVKRAQAKVLHLRDRLTLAQFAAEQEDTAAEAEATATLAVVFPLQYAQNAVGYQQRALEAHKVAELYRRVASDVGAHEAALFESLSNLGRWTQTLESYAALSQKEKDGVDVMFGKSAPRLPWQLKAGIDAEVARAAELVATIESEQARDLGAGLLVGAALVAGGVWWFGPAAALGALGAVASAAGVWYKKAKGLVS